ncbi:MATE family efflux transporter [Roseibium salinum]|nr:MATE family efflux transporter [Roseibium salinum]
MRTGRRALAPADLSDPRLKRLIVRLAVPAVIGLSINAAHHTVNAVFLGMLGPEALAAVTISIPALMLIAAIGEGLGVGSAAAIGRLLGGRQTGHGQRDGQHGAGTRSAPGGRC